MQKIDLKLSEDLIGSRKRGYRAPKLVKIRDSNKNTPLEPPNSIFQRLTLSYMFKVLRQANRSRFTKESLYGVHNDFKTSRTASDKLKAQIVLDGGISFKTLWIFARKYSAPLLILDITWYLLDSLQPLFLKAFIQWLERDRIEGAKLSTGVWIAFMMFGALQMKAFIELHLNVMETKCMVYLVKTLGGIITEKLARLPPSALNMLDFGQISYIIGGDLDKISYFIPKMNAFLSCVLFLGYYIYLLYNQITWPALLFPVLLLIGTACQKMFLVKYYNFDKYRRELADNRSNLVNDVITGIKTIKLNSWEESIQKRNLKTRRQESKTINKMILFKQSAYTLISIVVNLSMLVCFALYNKFVAELDVATAFAALALFQLVDHPFEKVISASTNYFTASISARRLYCLLSIRDFDIPQRRLAGGTEGGDDEDGPDNDSQISDYRPRDDKSIISLEGTEHLIPDERLGTEGYYNPNLGGIEIKKGYFRLVDQIVTQALEPLLQLEESEDDAKSTQRVQPNLQSSPRNLLTTLENKNYQIPKTSQNPIQTPLNLPKTRRILLENTPRDSQGVSSTSSHQKYILKNINLKIPPKSSACIVGEVGSGKTSLLNAILKELPTDMGQVRTNGSIAIVPQEPFIIKETIKNNILFGKAYNAALYQRVTVLCQLRDEIEMLENLDEEMLEERGGGLSLSFMHRISLARAVYSDSDIYIIDNCFNAFDQLLLSILVSDVLLGALMDKTRVVVSNKTQIMENCDRLFLIDDGTIRLDGPYNQVKNDALFCEKIANMEEESQEANIDDFANEHPLLHRGSSGVRRNRTPMRSVSPLKSRVRFKSRLTNFFDIGENGSEDQGCLSPFPFQITGMSVGSFDEISPNDAPGNANSIKMVETSDFLLLVQKGGIWLWILLISAMAGEMAIIQLLNFWIAKWGDRNYVRKDSFFISVYIGLVLLYSLVCLIKLLTISKLFERISFELFKTIFWKILRAKIIFFDSEPPGKIINRCTTDLEILDFAITQHSRATIFMILNMLSTCFVALLANFWVIILIFVIFGMFYCLLAMYIRTCVQLGKLYQSSKSPTLTKLYELTEGASSVRAYGYQRKLLRSIFECFDVTYSAFIHRDFSGCFVQMFANTLFNVMALIVGLLIAVAKTQRNMYFDLAVMSLVLSNFSKLSGIAVGLICCLSDLFSSMVSVKRLKEYHDLKRDDLEDELSKIPDTSEHQSWPKSGSIEVNNLSYKYPSFDELALKNISFFIRSGEKVGIIGANGSGKSTISLILANMLSPFLQKKGIKKLEKYTRRVGLQPSSEECEVMIDGVHINRLGLKLLRRSVVVVPQEACLLEGTIRSNIDPFDEFSNLQIIKTLNFVKFFSHIRKGRNKGTARRLSFEERNLELSAAVSMQNDHSEAPETSNRSMLNLSVGEGPGLSRNEDLTKISKLSNKVELEGSNLSIGQKQLICLARAIIRKPKVLILDESTSSLDQRVDSIVQKAIRKHLEASTVITISNRIRTVIQYDRLIVMKNGRIVENGPPGRLIKQKGYFYKLLKNEGDRFVRRMRVLATNGKGPLSGQDSRKLAEPDEEMLKRLLGQEEEVFGGLGSSNLEQ